jgi:hypothetical protein
MPHVDVLVGRLTRAAVCMICEQPIAVGDLGAYYTAPPKGSVHAECHVGRRGRPLTQLSPDELRLEPAEEPQ